MKEMLNERGYKATPARLAILDIFSKSKFPINAEIVYKNISKIKALRKTNEATIYRTLLSLESCGILKRINLRKNSAYFELADDHHHHIVCTKCNEIEDFENSELEKILGGIVVKSSKFKNVREHSLELFGLCRMCA
ncbi:MAG: transcriptional repressor [Patescibacteria group bacterium]|nr:transcriptional repressor [Patescibacteria group bacterium]